MSLSPDGRYLLVTHNLGRFQVPTSQLQQGWMNTSAISIVNLATPAEGLSGRFTKMDRRKYGKIPGVTDRDYYVNSFHVDVKEPS